MNPDTFQADRPPLWIISAHILSRFLLGVGTGIVLVFLFELDLFDAFIFVIIAVLVSVPSTYKMTEMRIKESRKR